MLPSPPGTCVGFYRAQGSALPLTARRFSCNFSLRIDGLSAFAHIVKEKARFFCRDHEAYLCWGSGSGLGWNCSGRSTVHDPARGSGQEVFLNVAGRVGTDHDLCSKTHGSGGPGQEVFTYLGSGRVTPDPIRPASHDPTRENLRYYLHTSDRSDPHLAIYALQGRQIRDVQDLRGLRIILPSGNHTIGI